MDVIRQLFVSPKKSFAAMTAGRDYPVYAISANANGDPVLLVADDESELRNYPATKFYAESEFGYQLLNDPENKTQAGTSVSDVAPPEVSVETGEEEEKPPVKPKGRPKGSKSVAKKGK